MTERRTPREAVRMLCQAVRERDFTLVGEVALDLSSTGMLLRTKRPVLTGESVLVSFFEPFGGRWYDTEATVARVVHARRTGDRERCVGLTFDGLAPAERVTLARSLDARRRWRREPASQVG